jgi:hypothetical protein
MLLTLLIGFVIGLEVILFIKYRFKWHRIACGSLIVLLLIAAYFTIDVSIFKEISSPIPIIEGNEFSPDKEVVGTIIATPNYDSAIVTNNSTTVTFDVVFSRKT